MAKSILEKAQERSRKIYDFLDKRGWNTPNDDSFRSARDKIASIEQEVISRQIKTLQDYLDEVKLDLIDGLTTMSGQPIKSSPMDKRRLETERRHIEAAIIDLQELREQSSW